MVGALRTYTPTKTGPMRVLFSGLERRWESCGRPLTDCRKLTFTNKDPVYLLFVQKRGILEPSGFFGFL